MLCNSFTNLFDWGNPFVYFLILVIVVMIIAVGTILYAYKLLQEEWGTHITYHSFNTGFLNIFKWTSQNPKMVGAVLGILVLIGIILTVNY